MVTTAEKARIFEAQAIKEGWLFSETGSIAHLRRANALFRRETEARLGISLGNTQQLAATRSNAGHFRSGSDPRRGPGRIQR